MLKKNSCFYIPILLLFLLQFVIIENSYGIDTQINQIPPVLKSASELDYPPFATVRPDGTADGFSVDLLKAVVNLTGADIEFEVGPWYEIRKKLENGELDVLPLVSYSEERDKLLDFTAPYLRMHGSIFVRKNEKRIHKEADLKNREVIVMRGDTAHEYAERTKLAGRLVLTDTFNEAMTLLSSGKHDAVIIQQVVGHQIIRKLGITNVKDIGTFKENSLRPVGVPLIGFEQKFCMAVKDGDKELLSRLNEGLAIVIADGTYDLLYRKWFEPILPRPSVSPLDIIKYVLAVLIPLILIMAVFSLWYLKHQVLKKTLSLRQEIEHRKEAEKALRDSKLRQNEAVRGGNVGLWDWDLITSRVNYSAEWKRQIGYEEHEISDSVEEWKKRIHPDDLDKTLKKVKKILKSGGQGDDIVFRFRHRNGSYRWILVHSSCIRNETGRSIRMLGSHIDITDRKKMEEELSQSRKMESIGTLAGGIAHEINNILGIIMGNTEMALNDAPEENSVREYLNEILNASHRAKDVVLQIMSFARKTPADRKPVRIDIVIQESLKLIRATIPASIKIHHQISPDIKMVLGNSTEISQILINLFRNSAQAMDNETGLIELTLVMVSLDKITTEEYEDVRAGEYVKLTVKDNGKGIDPGILDRVMEPYFTTKPVNEGLGMGLAVVYGLIKKHEGALRISSRQNEGTTVEILFPVTDLTEDVENSDSASLPSGTENILFVDDEPALVRMAVRILELNGYNTTGESSSVNALEIFRDSPDAFDLVISDVSMPEMTGDQLARIILEIRPDIPVILVSGYSERINDAEAEKLGVRAYAVKPLNKEKLLKTVRRVLDQLKS